MNLRKQVDTNRILDTDWRNYPGTQSRGRQVLQNLKRTEGETGAAEILFMLHGAVDIYYLSIYLYVQVQGYRAIRLQPSASESRLQDRGRHGPKVNSPTFNHDAP